MSSDVSVLVLFLQLVTFQADISPAAHPDTEYVKLRVVWCPLCFVFLLSFKKFKKLLVNVKEKG